MAQMRAIVADAERDCAGVLGAMVLATQAFELCNIAWSCEELLADIERYDPLMIFVDIGLMNRDGVNVLPLLWRMREERMLCVVGEMRVTAKNAIPFGKRYGVPLFLQKPCTHNGFCELLRTISSNPYRGHSRHEQMEMLLLDFGVPDYYAAFQLAVDGALLLRTAKRTYTSHELLRQVCELHGISESRGEANLRNLVKEADAASTPLYQSVFGKPERSPGFFPFLLQVAAYSRKALYFL